MPAFGTGTAGVIAYLAIRPTTSIIEALELPAMGRLPWAVLVGGVILLGFGAIVAILWLAGSVETEPLPDATVSDYLMESLESMDD